MRPTCPATSRMWWLARDLHRFVSAAANIRGLDDVRVVQMVDSMRLPVFYNGGLINFAMSGL